VAGVALMALGWIWWRAWSPLVARGAALLCVPVQNAAAKAGLCQGALQTALDMP